MENVQFIGLNKFENSEKVIINEITGKHLNKINRLVTNYLLIIKVKKHSIANKKLDEAVNYSLHAKIELPSIFISASYSDWDLKRTVHKTLEKLENELKHKFKSDKKSWVRKRYLNK